MTEKFIKTYMNKSKNAFQRALVAVPIKTGNLRYNAMKYKRLKGNKATIRLDLNVAPYGEYINRPGYRTEGWWNRFLETYLDELQKSTNARRER